MAIDLLTMLKPPTRRVSVEDIGLYILPQSVPPRNATIVDQSSSPVVPAGVPGVPGSVIGFQYRVPANRRGILARLGVDSVDPAALPFLRFAILRSQAPVPNYQNVETPIGSIGAPDTVNVTFDGDQFMQVQVTNSDNVNPRQVHVRVVAWFWDTIENWGK